MSLQTFASFSGGAVNVHIAEKLLKIAQKQVIFQQLGEKAQMPGGEGKTFQFNRYERLALPRTALTEGTPPASTNMSLTTVSATSDEWGAYIAISNVAQLTIKHNLMQVAMDLLGTQAAELVDREIINMLEASTNVTYGGTATTRNGLATASTDSLTDKVAQKVVSRLRQRGARAYEGQNFVGVIDPAMEQDVSQSSNSAFVSAAAYGNIKQLYNGEIGMWRGVRWMVSNFIPSITGAAVATATSPSSPAGTFTTANYRVSVAYISLLTGFIEKMSDPQNVACTNLDSLAVTMPSDTSYAYKIFVGLAAGAATDVFYQASESTYAFGEIPAAASAVVLAPPVSGTTAPAIPTTLKVVHLGWVFGNQAFCTVDLANLKTFVSAPQATTVDPLVQQRTVGYRLMFKPVIQNNDFLERIEVMSEFA